MHALGLNTAVIVYTHKETVLNAATLVAAMRKPGSALSKKFAI